jgi:hypothetical protein
MGERVEAYGHLGYVDWTCSMGHVHNMPVYSQRWLYPTGETITRDWWGYGQTTTEKSPVYRDRQGYEYIRISPMDFYGSTMFRPRTGTPGPALSIRKPHDGIRFDELEKLRGKA